jgi:hypothetical protein
VNAQVDRALADVVLELEADFILFRSALSVRDSSEHPALWAKTVKRLWFKVFQMSAWQVRTSADVPSRPGQLEQEVREMTSERNAAIAILASALVASSDEPDHREVVIEGLRRNVLQYLETPEGQVRRARVDHSLSGDLRSRGLKVRTLE